MEGDKRSERSRLAKAPLVFVLAQVRISPVLKMEEYVPAIQDQLRGKDFPRFSNVVGQQIVLGPNPSMTGIQQWVFTDRKRTSAVVLSQDSIVLETSDYGIFEDFSEVLLSVLSLIGEEASLDFAERLGLRYINVVRPEQTGDTFHKYLKRSVHGLDTSAISDQLALHRLETRVATENGRTLVVKVMHSTSGGFLPPDIDGTRLDFSHLRAVSPKEHVILLDIDHFSSEPLDFRPKELLKEMSALHVETRRAFEQVVTPYAIDQWEPVGEWNVKGV